MLRKIFLPRIFLCLVLGVVSNAQAEKNCTSDICEGNQIIDSYNDIGLVTKIEGAKVTYLVGNVTKTVAASCLSPEVIELNGFKKGVIVLDNYNQVGAVLLVFKNAKVRFLVEGATNPEISTKLVLEVEKLNDISANTIVIDSYNDVGKATHVFKDGRIQYLIDGATGPTVSNQLVPKVETVNEISADTVVLDSYNQVGRCLNVFKDGRIQYLVEGKTVPETSKNLSPEVSEIDGIKYGVIVLDNFNQSGVVRFVFKNKKAQYLVEGSFYNVSDKLVTEVEAKGNIRRGVLVLDRYDQIGEAVFIFKDGRIQYLVQGETALTVSRDLAAETSVLGNDRDVFKDITIVDLYNQIGVVGLVFENRRLQYMVEGASSPLVTSYDYVSPKIENNHKYPKTSIFALANEKNSFCFVGYPNRFFKDGRVELVSEENEVMVGKRLAPEVQEAFGYLVKTEIVNQIGTSGNVILVFENGVVKYLDSSSQSKFNALIFGMKENLVINDERHWISSLALYLSNQNFRSEKPEFIVKSSVYPQLKKKLHARLELEPGLVSDDELRKKVLNFLN